jgi:uncharacterized membrane protein YgcG
VVLINNLIKYFFSKISTMHKQQHPKINNTISKLAVIIVLSVVLLTGTSLVSSIQLGVYGQLEQQQQQSSSLQAPQQQQQNKIGLSQVIEQIAQQVATANPGTNVTQVYQILVQLAKQTAQTSSQAQAIQEIRQISSDVSAYPFGTLSQVLSYFAQQLASGNSNVVQLVQQTIQDKASTGNNNIVQSLSNTAVQEASGGSKNVNQVIRNAAQILASRAGVPVEKVEAVIVQIALQVAQAQGKAITGQYIFQIANQIIQDPNGVLAQAILQLVLQDDGGKTTYTTTIIKNVIKISRGGDHRKPHPKCDSGYHWDDKLKKCVHDDPCKNDPKATGCPDDPCKNDPKATGCEPEEDPCKNDPTAKGCEPTLLLPPPPPPDDGDTDTGDTDTGGGTGGSGGGGDTGGGTGGSGGGGDTPE